MSLFIHNTEHPHFRNRDVERESYQALVSKCVQIEERWRQVRERRPSRHRYLKRINNIM